MNIFVQDCKKECFRQKFHMNNNVQSNDAKCSAMDRNSK